MTESPKLGLTLTPASDNTKTFLNFRTELAGDSPTSNMMILDSEFGRITDVLESVIVMIMGGSVNTELTTSAGIIICTNSSEDILAVRKI